MPLMLLPTLHVFLVKLNVIPLEVLRGQVMIVVDQTGQLRLRRMKDIGLQFLDYLLDQSRDYFIVFHIQSLQGLVLLHGLDHDPACAVLQVVLA